jgi:exonuclease III
MSSDTHCNILNWNARGLNNPARCQVVKDLITNNNYSIVCLQETKLCFVNATTIAGLLGQKYVDHFAVLPADGTRGGIILACSHDRYSFSQVVIRQFSVTVRLTNNLHNETWSLSTVYGPQRESDKIMSMQEIKDIRQTVDDRWILMGDFNLIYCASDKSTGLVNIRLMNRFRQLLEEIEIKEIHIHGRKFTWSSGTNSPTQTKIDHVFVTKEWELLYPNCHLQPSAMACSDHCPMILTCNPFHRTYRGFRLESYWLQLPDFREMVTQSWTKPVSSTNKARPAYKISKTYKILEEVTQAKDVRCQEGGHLSTSADSQPRPNSRREAAHSTRAPSSQRSQEQNFRHCSYQQSQNPAKVTPHMDLHWGR